MCVRFQCFEVYSCTLPPHTVVTKHAQRHCRVDTSPSSTDLPILMAPPRCRCGRRCTRYRGSGTLPSYVCSCAVCKYCGAFGIQLVSQIHTHDIVLGEGYEQYGFDLFAFQKLISEFTAGSVCTKVHVVGHLAYYRRCMNCHNGTADWPTRALGRPRSSAASQRPDPHVVGGGASLSGLTHLCVRELQDKACCIFAHSNYYQGM